MGWLFLTSVREDFAICSNHLNLRTFISSLLVFSTSQTFGNIRRHESIPKTQEEDRAGARRVGTGSRRLDLESAIEEHERGTRTASVVGPVACLTPDR